jgi:cleavage and polyadenylation specificity factor subunit 1
VGVGGLESLYDSSSINTAMRSPPVCPCFFLPRIIFVKKELEYMSSSDADHSTCTISLTAPATFASPTERISSCTLYCDRGPEPWLRKARTDAWLSAGTVEATGGNDSYSHDGSEIYCIICYESGKLEIFEVPSFKCAFSVENFISGPAILFDDISHTSTKDAVAVVPDITKVSMKKEEANNIKVVELAMHRWSGLFSRPFLFGLLNDGTLLCYHAYYYEGSESNAHCAPLSLHCSSDLDNSSDSRLKNLRFRRVSIDVSLRDDIPSFAQPRITVFNNVGGYEGLFLGGPRPTWVFVCRQRFRVHPQVSKCYSQ